MHGHVPEIVKRLAPLSALPATTTLKLTIGLPLRNQDALTNLLHDLYDPSSPRYRQYLTPDQFAQQFGPTEQDYQSVIAFAKAHGLTVTGTHSNRVLLDVSGPVSNVEDAFQVNLHVYHHPREPRTFFAPDTEPLVPSELPILDIEGLNNYILPRPKFHKEPAPSTTNAPTKVGTGPNGLGYMGSDFRNAYAPGVTNTGVGQSVALVEFDGFYSSDITSYETTAHLSTSTPITPVLLNGFNGKPSGTSDNGAIEVSLDIEMVLSMAPGISDVYVYEEAYTTNVPTVNDLLDRIATDNSAKQISCSWVIYFNSSSDSIFQQFAAQGQSFYNASGDDDAYIGDVVPPSDDPYITQVGGTTLTTSGAGGPWSSETTWQEGGGSGSSGGVSPYYAMPGWQQGVNMTFNDGSPTQRNFPDVAAVANNVFIVAEKGVQQSVGGTSCAAPLWAGYTALVNQQATVNGQGPVGFINPAVYNIGLDSDYTSDLHDITTGNNTNSIALSEFYATNGYDLCTGLGTPNGGNLMNTLLASPDPLQVTPISGFTATGLVGGPFNISQQTYTLTNNSGASLNWSSTTTASWLSVSPASGTLASHSSVSATVGLTPAANSLAVNRYAGTVWFTNLTSHFGQSRAYAIQVAEPLARNPGFETGDFAHWVLAGDDDTYDFVDNGALTGVTAHSGAYFAALGFPGTPATLTQYIPTFPGQPYLLSFWWQNPTTSTLGNLSSGVIPNQFFVKWNGNALINKTNMAVENSWTNFQFLVAATNTLTPLQFGASNTNGAFCIDDVTVTNFPQPAFTSVKRTNNTVTMTWSTVANYNYQLQYNTNLLGTNWTVLNGTIKATSSTTTTTDSTTNSPERFYRIALIL